MINPAIIGRTDEINTLRACFESALPEFVAVYGRRRIGKTYLIKEFFKDTQGLFFSFTGEKDAPMKKQINHFAIKMRDVFYHGAKLAVSKSICDAT